jgi:hypothetical protein
MKIMGSEEQGPRREAEGGKSVEKIRKAVGTNWV